MANENASPPPNATVIWERTIDREYQAVRVRRMLRWYVYPALAVVAIGGGFGGLGVAAGLLILLGLFGLLLVTWVLLVNHNEASHAVLWTLDGRLHQTRKLGIPVGSVNEFSIRQNDTGVIVNGVSTSTPGVTATFRGQGAVLEWLTWPCMPDAHIPELTAVLERLLPGKLIGASEMERLLRQRAPTNRESAG